MDVSFILDGLNEAQRDAVTSDSKKLLVLAGAGSGKTKVLVHRIAWLNKALSFSTHSILAVTFTNKAASEMKGRIEEILEQPIPEMWCGTFHSISIDCSEDIILKQILIEILLFLIAMIS